MWYCALNLEPHAYQASTFLPLYSKFSFYLIFFSYLFTYFVCAWDGLGEACMPQLRSQIRGQLLLAGSLLPPHSSPRLSQAISLGSKLLCHLSHLAHSILLSSQARLALSLQSGQAWNSSNFYLNLSCSWDCRPEW